MDTTIARFIFAGLAVLVAAYLIWPQVAVWLDRVKEPVCGKCRYPVAGIAALRCPECGSDLRQVGIMTPAMMARRAAGRRTRLAAWTLIWAVAGVGSAVAIAALIPGRFLATRSSPLQLNADQGVSIDIDQRSEGWNLNSARRTFVLKLQIPATPHAFGEVSCNWPGRIISSTAGTADSSSQSLVGRELTGELVHAWLARAGVPGAEVAGPQLIAAMQAVADQPVNMASDVAVGSAWTFGGSTIGVRRFTPWWVQTGMGAAWLIVWAIGLAWLARRRQPTESAEFRAAADAKSAEHVAV